MKLLVMPESETYDKTLPFLPSKACFSQVTALYPHEPRLPAIEQAEVIIGEPSLEELRHARCLKLLQMTWAGADRYMQGGFPRDVLLTTATGAFGETIAEHALGMLLSLCRRFPAYVRQGSWQCLGSEKRLAGGRALIFGAGDIGTQIALRLQALQVDCIGVCRDVSRPRPGFSRLLRLEEADALLPEADFILCALPRSPETENYFHAGRLSLCKSDAVLVNVGRGTLVDTEALTAQLQCGRFFGVGLDVLNPEPLPSEHPLWRLPNVLITPHVAGTGFGHLPETEEKIWAIAEENLRHFLRGEALRNQVMP